MAAQQGMKVNGEFALDLLEAILEEAQNCTMVGKTKVLPEGFRWSQPNVAAAAVVHWGADTRNTGYYHGTVTACLSIFADGDVIVAFFDSLDLSGFGQPDLSNLRTSIDFHDQSDIDRAVAELASDLDEEMETLAEYAESWDEGNDDDY